MYKNFHEFYASLNTKLSEVELDAVVPIRSGPVPGALAPLLHLDVWLNWTNSHDVFGITLIWLKDLHARLPEDVVVEKFALLTPQEKGFIQCGYQIMHEERFPPFFDGMMMHDGPEFYVVDKIPDCEDEFPCIVQKEKDDRLANQLEQIISTLPGIVLH